MLQGGRKKNEMFHRDLKIVLPSLCRNAWNLYKTLNLLSDAVCWSREVGSSAVKKRRYPEHQARSIIFLKNHYCCVLPCGWSSGRENRSGGMTISSDLITSGAKPDNGKWFLVLNVSVCQIHDWTKIVLMNSWHSKNKKNKKIVIPVSECGWLRVAVVSVSVNKMICKCLGTYSTTGVKK